MSHRWSRRQFVHTATGLGALGLGALEVGALAQAPPAAVPDWVPLQDPAVVKEMVTVAHSDVKRVRELLARQPALANAAIDWGFGDWEDALGAAAHTGRREIAEVLLAHGARMSIYAAAMLGYLDVVKAFVAVSPGIQRTLGPHGIPLLQHAQAGGPASAPVVQYLDSLGDAGLRPPSQALAAGDRDAVVGRYVFGTGPRDHFDIDVRNDQLGIARPEASRRFLIHTGSLVFFPSGVPSVKIAFARDGGQVTQLTIANPEVYLTARRT